MDDHLFDAVKHGDVERARSLLEDGANPHEDLYGLSIIVEALERRDERMVQLLMKFGAMLPVDAAGRTELHRAASSDDAEEVALLLRVGLDPNASDHHGWTALHFAAAYGYERVASALLAGGADPTATTTEGLRPADMARANAQPWRE